MKYKKVELYEYGGEYYKTVEEVEEAVNNGLWCIIEDINELHSVYEIGGNMLDKRFHNDET